MTAPFFSRARLRTDVPVAALRDVLLPPNDERRVVATHHAIWQLFGDTADRRRDFLWREGTNGCFYLLSARAPVDRRGVFELDPPKTFAPSLSRGQRLRFSLRTNATVARRTERGKRSKRSDVVMDALFRLPSGLERSSARAGAVEEAGHAWLERQSTRSGFAVAGRPIVSYRVLRMPHRGSTMSLGVLDLDGVLIVQDPTLLLAAITHGFGRAKAFGCGLMLIQRA